VNRQQFLYSLLLLLVGQVPLLIKLHLEHRGKADPYRKHLYERQASAFLDLHIALAKVHAGLHNLLLVFPDGPDDDKHKEFHSSVAKSLSDQLTAYSEALDRAELFLPADIALQCWHCKTLQYQLFGATMGIRSIPRQELLEQWDKLAEHFNLAVNGMRLCMGVDSLSRELFELLSSGRTKALVNTLSLRESFTKLGLSESPVTGRITPLPKRMPDGTA